MSPSVFNHTVPVSLSQTTYGTVYAPRIANPILPTLVDIIIRKLFVTEVSIFVTIHYSKRTTKLTSLNRIVVLQLASQTLLQCDMITARSIYYRFVPFKNSASPNPHSAPCPDPYTHTLALALVLPSTPAHPFGCENDAQSQCGF